MSPVHYRARVSTSGFHFRFHFHFQFPAFPYARFTCGFCVCQVNIHSSCEYVFVHLHSICVHRHTCSQVYITPHTHSHTHTHTHSKHAHTFLHSTHDPTHHTTRGSHIDVACRNVCDRDQNGIKRSTLFLGADQGIKMNSERLKSTDQRTFSDT